MEANLIAEEERKYKGIQEVAAGSSSDEEDGSAGETGKRVTITNSTVLTSKQSHCLLPLTYQPPKG